MNILNEEGGSFHAPCKSFHTMREKFTHLSDPMIKAVTGDSLLRWYAVLDDIIKARRIEDEDKKEIRHVQFDRRCQFLDVWAPTSRPVCVWLV